MRLIAKMRGINVKKSTTTKKTKRKKKESPFRPVIQDIKDKLSKSGDKLIKKGLYYVEKNERINRTTSKNY